MTRNKLIISAILVTLTFGSITPAYASQVVSDGGGVVSTGSNSNDYGSNLDLTRVAIGAMSAAAAGELGTIASLTARAVISLAVPTILGFFGF